MVLPNSFRFKCASDSYLEAQPTYNAEVLPDSRYLVNWDCEGERGEIVYTREHLTRMFVPDEDGTTTNDWYIVE